MPTFTPNYNLAKPLVNSAVDQDLWGNELNGDMDIIDSTMKSISDAVPTVAQVAAAVYPLGSIYINYSDNTNPATLLGFGTWTSLQDRFLIGAGGTYAAGTTGGATTHTLTAGEIPPLTYTISLFGSNGGVTGLYIANSNGTNSTNATATGAVATNAGGGAHSILNPYVAVYMWRRTA